MEDNIEIEPVIGDAIVKTETITWDQMHEQILNENLLHNPEMHSEMKIKWNNERKKHFKTDNENQCFNSELSIPANYEEPSIDDLENDEDFQNLMHEKLCVNFNKPLCRPCEEKHSKPASSGEDM